MNVNVLDGFISLFTNLTIAAVYNICLNVRSVLGLTMVHSVSRV